MPSTFNSVTPNPLVRRLGFDEDARVVVLHVDDVGMCHATLGAWEDILDCGLPISCSLMVPCPWFSEAASIARRRSDQDLDIGIHVTLTSEWSGFRWGPISTRDITTGLLDSEGLFHRSVDALRAAADPKAVHSEISCQFQRASEAGIDVTHIDSHMGAVFCPSLLQAYFRVANENRVPAVWFRSRSAIDELGLDPHSVKTMIELTRHLTDEGTPLIDHLLHMQLDDPADRLEETKNALARLPSGVTHFMIHPARDTPELRHITPDWACRVADYHTFTDRQLHQFLRDTNIHFTTYRNIRDLGSTTLPS